MKTAVPVGACGGVFAAAIIGTQVWLVVTEPSPAYQFPPLLLFLD
jgi:hypothetical protein